MIATVLLAVLGTVTACSKPEPGVSFFSAGHEIRTKPIQYCNSQVTTCYTANGDTASLAVPAGDPLQISVDSDVAQAVWVVVFKYRDQNGATQEDRSALFPAGTQYAYTLRPPTPSDQLTLVQVQQIGAITMAPGDTAPTYQATRVWSLTATG
ncbi:MAG TPA: DUF2771 family protein [Pseudonocardiaceae bacterium]|jgi:hypothetical protein|nr:DUF2771 family protein [Pseudonocardiaceae bacterium]